MPELGLGAGAVDRVVVVAAHPDDESLGAGGTIAALRRAGVPVVLALATAGEGSHPLSPTIGREELRRRRLVEAERAWTALGGDAGSLLFWNLPDGALADAEDDLVGRLVAVVGDGRRTLLLTPWRHDGHPDHDALGRAGRRAAYRTGARLLQFPIWFWHRAAPADAPWAALTAVFLTAADRADKARAVASHVTQVGALSPEPGDEVLLGPILLEHFSADREVFVVETADDGALDELHVEHEDPWGTTTRWYEERKRALTLGMLARPHYDRGLDIGCSTGTLSLALAERCGELVAVDRSPRAVQVAHRRLERTAGVEVRQADVPHTWPEGDFDLIVVSESGYFLSPASLDLLVERIAVGLHPGGALVLAHWRHPIGGWPLTGADVHARFAAASGVPDVAARYRDRDVEIVLHTDATGLPDPAR